MCTNQWLIDLGVSKPPKSFEAPRKMRSTRRMSKAENEKFVDKLIRRLNGAGYRYTAPALYDQMFKRQEIPAGMGFVAFSQSYTKARRQCDDRTNTIIDGHEQGLRPFEIRRLTGFSRQYIWTVISRHKKNQALLEEHENED